MLRRRPFVALVVGEVASSLGTTMAALALPWFVLETTGSPARMSAVLAAEALPLALLAPVSGRFAGRIGARATLLACDAFWAPVVALVPLLHWAGALSFGVLLALAFLAGIPWAAHHGSQGAIVPELLGEDPSLVARANAVFQTASRLTYFAGPALGGVLLGTIGAPAVLVVDAATFAVSFVVIAAFVPARAAPPPLAGEGRAGGLAVIRRDPLLRRIVGAQFLSQGAFMAMLAAVPVLAFEELDRSGTLAGLLLAAWGGGALAGGALAYRLVVDRDPLRLGAAAWCLQALPLWAMALSPPPAVALAALAASGLGNGIRVPPVYAITIARIPAAVRADAMTVSSSIMFSAGLFALLAAGPALERLGAGAVFAGIALAQTAAAGILVAYRGRVSFPDRGPTPEV